MSLTKHFKNSVVNRAKADSAFREAMLIEAVNSLLEGEIDTAKLMLRDYINATISFTPLAEKLNKNPKSLQRMLGHKGNPTAKSLFEMLSVLQKTEGVHLSTTPCRDPC